MLALVAAMGLCPSDRGGAGGEPAADGERLADPTGNVRVGVPIAFTATATDPDGDTLTYLWDFGDGTTSTEQNPTKAYLAAATVAA